MIISEYIKHLEHLKNIHGDIKIKKFRVDGNIIDAPIPREEFLKVLQGKETKIRYWNEWNGSIFKGEKVIGI